MNPSDQVTLKLSTSELSDVLEALAVRRASIEASREAMLLAGEEPASLSATRLERRAMRLRMLEARFSGARERE